MKKEKIPKINYFEDDDVLNIYWGKPKGVESSIELKNVNVLIDLSKKGGIIGFEIDSFKKSFKKNAKFIEELFKTAEKE